MESYEASRTVFTRIQTLDPENASKIMGYILLHHNENDMLHLSFAPETHFISLVNRAKTHLGISSNTLCASLIPPISNPISISRPNPLSIPLSNPRLSNGFPPSSPSSPSIWSPHHISVSPSNGNLNNINNINGVSYGVNFSEGSNNVSFLDDFTSKDQNLGNFITDPVILPSKNVDFSEQNMDLPSIWDNNSNNITENNGGNNNHNLLLHRRSSSFNDSLSYFGTDDSTSGFGLKPCLYYSKGFCKNGNNCKFVHGGGFNGGFCDDSNYDAFEQCQDEIFRSKIAHQHRFAAHLMSSAVTLPFNKLGFFHSDPQRSAAAMMISEDLHKLNQIRMARNEFNLMECNPASRQIYLTFPADSTFKEEDVSNYFNKYGPVQDVRIPYQQKRMFGFVTFVFAETVKIILAKGNPHFVCDSRVLVKPYKEKSKLPDKKHQYERGEFSCSSPSSHDCREPYDFQLGGRMMYSTQEMLLRKKFEEQADFQHALELQERRLMNLQLLDLKSQQNQHHVSVRSPVSSSVISNDAPEESKVSSNEEEDEVIHEGVNTGVNDSNENDPKKEANSANCEENEFFESLDHVLPENLFASPTKPSLAPTDVDNGTLLTDSLPAAMSSLSMAPPKSCFFEMPRISNGHGAIGM
ncbi:hypothetical protein RND81_12G179700 [Saponaria officinalis]|uniref:Uncharacterized protein n=1 Tax=Saponaria officinalis TaxID=3572 RepID=A0AAW1HC38_SAPOF